ncbi:LADA_0E13234g1_1 [Lachancea dasiensis]|uniref:Increased recombination centers protein 22 n=1 Tax=Lachancea dasiensis TaxID=1072105 RepID=A0A1G4JG24_9SACH|nr:LADA_0E13234g1_1 [Lachancea dasiensis]
MKLSCLSISLLTIFKVVFASVEELPVEMDDSTAIGDPRLDRPNFDISYETLEQGAGNLATFLEFEEGSNATLKYSFHNNEEVNVSVVAVGGSLYDVHAKSIAANISAATVGPIPAAVNGSIVFQQIVKLLLPEGEYVLSPDIYVEINEQTMRIIANPSLIRVLPPPMSFFNPKFILVQLVLALLIVGVSYSALKPARGVISRKKPSSKDNLPGTVSSGWLPANHAKR